MKILLLGGTGMVGQGVLRECLLDPAVDRVISLGRSALEQRPTLAPEKFQEIVQRDLYDLSNLADQLTEIDACFFCLGVSVLGLTEAQYTHITYDLTLSIAETLAPRNPGMKFVYVTGAGTDSSERGSSMWARVKGKTENALIRLFGSSAYMFRPGIIIPLHGIQSKTRWYRLAYAILTPVMRLSRTFAPNASTTTEQVGRAMLRVAKEGFSRPVLEMRDINSL